MTITDTDDYIDATGTVAINDPRRPVDVVITVLDDSDNPDGSAEASCESMARSKVDSRSSSRSNTSGIN